MNPSPLIIAHRGASRHAPENTLAAFKLAIEAGAEGVEFDVRLSKDDVPVVIHDPSLKRTGRLSGKVADLTASELAAVDVGSWFYNKRPQKAAEFAGETIPTLKQALHLLEGFDGLIYVELKADRTRVSKLASAVSDVLRDSKPLPRVIVKSFDLKAVIEIRRHLPDATTAALFAPQIKNLVTRRRHVVDIARDAGADQISIHRSLLTRSLMKRAAEAEMAVTVWTVDDPKWIRRCRQLGVGALITNDPALMLAARKGTTAKMP